MNLNRKWSVLTAGAVALSLVLAACSSGTKAPTPAPAPVTPTEATGDTGKPVDGGTLTWATTSDIRTLNPLFINDTPSQSLANLVFAPILNWDSKGTPVADEAALAAEMPTISADGLTYTVKLKSTPKWTDGKPVTADDVVFTLNAWKDPEVASPSIAAYDKVADVKKVDDTTVEIKMKEVYAPFIYTLTTAILPAHILKDVPPTELIKHKYGTDPATFVSNGPYKWASWTQQQSTSLEADPNYWAAKKAHIKTIIYKKYADQNTQLQALVKGEVDLIEQIPVASLAAAQNKPDIKLVEGPGNAYDFVGFNFNKENWPDGFVPFEGKKTRQAIAHALNRKGMVDSVLKGHGTLLNGPFLPGAWADAGTAINYDYNVETAKKLLAEDGWKPGSDGILEKDGHKFEFKLQFNAGNVRREALGPVIQDNLKQVGITVTLEPLEFSSWIDNNVTPGKFQSVLLGWQLGLDPDAESLFSTKYNPPGGQNIGWYKNDTTDKLWVDGYKVTDLAKRKEVYGQLAKEISDDLPYVFLYQQNSIEGFQSRVKYADADKPVMAISYGTAYHMQYWWLADGK